MSMSNEISPDQMQARIQQARREAENLKDRIKRKKDELADGTRKLNISPSLNPIAIIVMSSFCDCVLMDVKFRVSLEVNKKLSPRTR